MNLLPIIKDDFVDVCLKMVDGNLNGVAMEKSATVLTYKVPADYGGYAEAFPDKVDKAAINTPVDLAKAEALSQKIRRQNPHLPWLDGTARWQKLCA